MFRLTGLIVCLQLLSTTQSDLSKVCCFEDADIKVQTFGGSSSMLTIDGFFCTPFINFMKQFADASRDHTIDDTSSFPGWRVMFDVREHEPRLRDIKEKANFGPNQTDFLEALLYGHYLKCVARAVKTVDLSPFQSAVFQTAFEKSQAGGLSMVNQRPSPFSNVHIDPGNVVLNVPLVAGFEDTSTAFYKTQSGQEQCIGDEDAIRACRNSIDKHTTFSVVQDHRLSTLSVNGPCVDVADQCVEWAAGGRCPVDVEEMHRDCKHSCGVCGGLWLGAHNPPTGQDHSGAFEKHHEILFKLNRLVLYSGHLFHSSYISRDALLRIEQAFEVCLKSSPELPGWGLSLSERDGRMHIAQVHNAGPMHNWNAAHSHNQVQIGSFVLEVNGKRGEFMEMNKALQGSADELCLVVSPKNPDKDVWTNGRLMLQNFIPEPKLALPGKQYDHMVAMNGMEVAIGKIMAGQTAVGFDAVTLKLIHDLATVNPELKQKLDKLMKFKANRPVLSRAEL